MEYKVEKAGPKGEMFIDGELKFGDHGIVDAVTTVLDDDTITELVLNLSNLAKLDSYGIGILLKADQLALDRNKKMSVRGANGSVADVFAMFNLGEALTIVED